MSFDPNDPYELDRIQWRVKKGTELLDEHYDRWEDAITVSELQMDSTDSCVVGQIAKHPMFGRVGNDYNDLLPLLFGDWTGDDSESAYAHGFDIAGGEFWTEEYEALGHEWAKVIEGRKNT